MRFFVTRRRVSQAIAAGPPRVPRIDPSVNPAQLPFDLPHRASLARDDLIVTDANRLAVAAIDSWPNWHHPVLLVVGKREAEEGTVALRRLGSQGQTMLSLDEVAAMLADEAKAPDLR